MPTLASMLFLKHPATPARQYMLSHCRAKWLWLVFSAVLGISAGQMAAAGPPPTVTPSVGALASNAPNITIVGTNFAALFSDNSVTLSSGTAHVAGQTGQVNLNVVFDTPPAAGPLMAVVTTPDGNSGAPVQVATVGVPVVTTNITNIPKASTTLFINGFGFSPTPGNNTVVFSPSGTGTVTGATTSSLTVTGITGLALGALNAVVTSNGQSSGAPVQVAMVGAVRAGFNTSVLAANDDGSTANVPFGFTIDLFGFSYSGGFVNNNGNVTFDTALNTFTPAPIATAGVKIIAPFWGDVDTRGVGSGLTRYGTGTVNGRPAWGATWDHVGYYAAHVDKLNWFQVILVDRSDLAVGAFDIEFNYNQIQWETGDVSGGISARAGYSNGTTTSFEVTGSGINGAFLDSNPTGLVATAGGALQYQSVNGNITPTLARPVKSPLGDVVSADFAPDAGGGGSLGVRYDGLKRGGFLAQNSNLVFPGYLLVGVGTPPVTVSPNTFMGLWKDNGSGLKLLARSGDNAPETGATAAKFDVLPVAPAINDSGEVTFLASLAVNASSTPPTTVDNDTGFWSELGSSGLRILLREGDVIPLVPAPPSPLQVGAFASGAFATAHTGLTTGEAAFAMTLKDGANLTDTAILRASISGPAANAVTGVGIVARENAAMPGVSGENFGNLAGSYSDSMRMDATGNLAFVALSKPSARESLWYQPVGGGAATKVFIAGTAATGDVAPGTSNATFKNIKSPAIGSGGVITFRGFLNANGDNTGGKKGDGIWRGTGSTLASYNCILRAGDDNTNRVGLGLPAGAKVGNLWHSWLTNANHGAWRGWLDVDGNGTSAAPTDVNAIYTDLSGTMTLKVKVGDSAPDMPAGATFASFDLPVVGGVEQMAFIGIVTGGGTTTANKTGIWRSAPNGGALSLVLRTGATIPTAQGDKTVAKIDFPGSGSTDRRWEQPVMDATGRLLVYVTFVQGGATAEILVP